MRSSSPNYKFWLMSLAGWLALLAGSPTHAMTLAKRKIQFQGFIPHKCEEGVDFEVELLDTNPWRSMRVLTSDAENTANATQRLLKLNSNEKLIALNCLHY